MNKCLFCGLETNNPKFCSRSCAAKSNNCGIAHNKPKPRKCNRCGTRFYRNKSPLAGFVCLLPGREST